MSNGVDFSDYIDFMALQDPDLNAWGGEKSVLPPGEYNFEITDVEKGQSSNGNPQLILTNKVLDGNCKGQTMRSWFVMTQTQGARARLKNLLQACEVGIDNRGGFSVQALIGRKYAATVIEDEYTTTDQTGASVINTTMRIQQERPASGI